MIGWIVVAAVCGLLLAYGVYRAGLRQRRKLRRRERRNRHFGYQKVWDQIMRQPRIKRLTSRDNRR
ncbi:MAG: hypothetical protein ACRYFW_14130 [Janthinobacterium lividum]